MTRKTKKAGLKAEIVKPVHSLKLQSTSYKWEGQSFPYIEEHYLFGEEQLVVGNYISSDSIDFEKFLFAAIRDSQPPKWIRTNVAKIKKKIKDELKHRTKLCEKLSKEQKEAISTFFQDQIYFDRDEADEYFDLELEKCSMHFLRVLLSTPNYESFVRQGLRRRKIAISKYG